MTQLITRMSGYEEGKVNYICARLYTLPIQH